LEELMRKSQEVPEALQQSSEMIDDSLFLSAAAELTAVMPTAIRPLKLTVSSKN
jgi:hypothetical protein